MTSGITRFLRENLKDPEIAWTLEAANRLCTSDTLQSARCALVSPRFLQDRALSFEHLVLLPDEEGVYTYRKKRYYSPFTLFEKGVAFDAPVSFKSEEAKRTPPPKRMDLEELYVMPGYYLHLALSLSRFLRSFWDDDKNTRKAIEEWVFERYVDFLSSNLSTVPLKKKYHPWGYDQAQTQERKRIRWIQVLPLLPFQPLNTLHEKSLLNEVIYHGSRMSESMRWPHPSHAGVIDLLESPESEEMGRVLTKVPGAQYLPEELRFLPASVETEKVQSLMSWATRTVPFANYSDGPRVMMGGKNLKQAVKVVSGERPIIGTGVEEELRMDWGVNAFVGYALYHGLNFEDGIVASEGFAKRMAIEREEELREDVEFPCPAVFQMQYDRRDNRVVLSDSDAGSRSAISVELVFKRKGHILTRNGEFGSITVYFVDKDRSLPAKKLLSKVLIYKERYPAELLLDLDNEDHRERLIRFVQRKYPFGKAKGTKEEKAGVVLNTSIVELRVPIFVRKPLEVGDKITGRHGNKGTISKVLPDSSMPYVLKNGQRKPLDLILSPFGIITRMNLGQLLETHLSLVSERTQKSFTTVDPADCLKHMKESGFVTDLDAEFGKADLLLDGYRVSATVGYQYFVRLNHCVRDKLHVISKTDRINLNTFQPYKGRSNDGGQRMGEMEFWTLFNHGATELIDLFAHTNLSDWKDKEKYIARLNEILQYYHRYTLSTKAAQGKVILTKARAESISLKNLLLKEMKNPEDASLVYRLIKRDIRKQCVKRLLASKEGYIRKCMLGRRVHYSGRATITPATDITIDQVKLPLEFALEWFPHFKISARDRDRVFNGDRSKRAEICKRVNESLPEGLFVLLNRQPSLHRHSMASFKPVFWEEYAIGLPIMVCEGFGADFDGDTMAAFYPITQEKNVRMQEELEGMRPSRHPFRSGNRDFAYSLSQDLLFGYWRKWGSAKIKSHVKDILNSSKPDEIPDRLLSFQTECLDEATRQNVSLSFYEVVHQKGDLLPIMESKARGKEAHFEKMKRREGADSFGSGHTVSSYFGLGEDREPLPDFDERIVVQTRRSMMDKKFHVGEGGYFTRKLVELLYPVRVTESDCGAQEGLRFPRAYLEELIDKIVLEGSANLSQNALEVRKERASFLFRKLFLNRYVRDKHGTWALVDEEALEHLFRSSEDIEVRSPVKCATKNGMLCSRCLGLDPSKIREGFAIDDFVGVMAGHTIGERGTQLSMKTFQTGDYGFRMQRVSSFFFNLEGACDKGSLGYLEYFRRICLASVQRIMSADTGQSVDMLATQESASDVGGSLLQTIDVISLHLEILYREMSRLNLQTEAQMLDCLTDWRKRGFFTALSFENPRKRKGGKKSRIRKRARRLSRRNSELKTKTL